MHMLFRRRTTYGFRRALAATRQELQLMRRHRHGLKRARTLPLDGDTRLQLGCGDQPKPGWINVDLYNPHADVALDLREDLPFPSNSIAFIYSEHVFEHFAYPTDARHILTECLRVLRPGGMVSLVVPHFGEALLAYARGDESFFTDADRPRSYLLRERPTLMHHVNYWFRQDGLHQYAYDADTLGQVLRDVGFDGVRERAFDPQLDSEKRYRLHSLYMDAITPATHG
jgi:predicted SAM-dependent methyltransferase